MIVRNSDLRNSGGEGEIMDLDDRAAEDQSHMFKINGKYQKVYSKAGSSQIECGEQVMTKHSNTLLLSHEYQIGTLPLSEDK